MLDCKSWELFIKVKLSRKSYYDYSSFKLKYRFSFCQSFNFFHLYWITDIRSQILNILLQTYNNNNVSFDYGFLVKQKRPSNCIIVR